MLFSWGSVWKTVDMLLTCQPSRLVAVRPSLQLSLHPFEGRSRQQGRRCGYAVHVTLPGEEFCGLNCGSS